VALRVATYQNETAFSLQANRTRLHRLTGDITSASRTHLTLPRLRREPLPLPPLRGRRGVVARPSLSFMPRPLEPVGRPARVWLGILFFVLFVAAWAVATFGGWVPRTFLADPLTMLREGWALLFEHGFIVDIGVTIWRVVGGFLLAAIMAVPLGVLMGAYKPFEAFLEPFVSFARYLPASAFIPLLILWAGIGEMQKLLVIFIGSVFQIILMVAVAVGNTRRDLVEAAYTLGAREGGIIRRVLIPSAAPEIAEILRLVLGWAWTYVIVAELIGSSSGIGHMIVDSQALLNTGQIIFGIIVIGLIGLISDFAFKAANQALFPWFAIGGR
jgi:NitT/TauT family transport system permease protein